MAQLKYGDRAPDFRLTNQNGEMVSLADFEGRKVLVYFYPKAMTSGCTTQACSVRDSLGDLEYLDVVPIGISPDDADFLKEFEEKHSLNFLLLSDSDHSVAQSYGAWGLNQMYGKEYEGIIRSAFLIDEKGTVIGIWYKVKPEDTVPNMIKLLEG